MTRRRRPGSGFTRISRGAGPIAALQRNGRVGERRRLPAVQPGPDSAGVGSLRRAAPVGHAALDNCFTGWDGAATSTGRIGGAPHRGQTICSATCVSTRRRAGLLLRRAGQPRDRRDQPDGLWRDTAFGCWRRAKRCRSGDLPDRDRKRFPSQPESTHIQVKVQGGFRWVLAAAKGPWCVVADQRGG